jgi:hypothetical protein
VAETLIDSTRKHEGAVAREPQGGESQWFLCPTNPVSLRAVERNANPLNGVRMLDRLKAHFALSKTWQASGGRKTPEHCSGERGA